MKVFNLYIVGVCFGILFFVTNAFAIHKPVIRLAVFDNPQADPSKNENLNHFVGSYLAGINTAITVAAEEGIDITEKEFFHTNNLSNIIQQASNVKAWEPDVIVGLSTSNDFIMSKAFFGDQIVLSISATDYAISKLPKGFYSLGIPDTRAVETIIKFVDKHYPGANLFVTASAEAKESVDFADLLATSYSKKYPNRRVTERKFLAEDINHLDFSKFMSGYHENDVIVIMSIGYDSAIDLMNRIAGQLAPVSPVFITSADNWGNDMSPQNMVGQYSAYRIDTLSGSDDAENYQIFLKNFKKIYHTEPVNKISFVTYRAVMSIVEGQKKFGMISRSGNVRGQLLNSYTSILKNNKNWWRPSYCVVYKLQNQKEVYFEKVA